MVDHITIDFETFSELDVRKVGAWRYSEHPSTDVLCLAYILPGEGVKLWTPLFEPLDQNDIIPQDLLDEIAKGTIIEAHNNEFERAIWKNVLEKKYNFPELPFDQCRCSAAKAAALALPRKLEDLSKALSLPIEKDMTGNRLMLKLSKPRKALKKERDEIEINPDEHLVTPYKVYHEPSDEFYILKNEKPDELLRVFDYCKTDTIVEEEASKIMPDLSPNELEVWRLDQIINMRGIKADLKLVDICLDFIKRYETELLAELKDITNNEIQTAGQRDKIIDYIGREGYELEGLTKAHVESAIEDSSISPKAKRILEIRKALSLSSTKKFQKIKQMACDDGRIRGTLLYHGANTGRWAGRGIQVQNLPRGTVDPEPCIELLLEKDYSLFKACYPDVLGAISSCIRGTLIADKDKKFYCADFSSIESRALFWLADEKEGLAIYKGSGKIYEAMAAEIYNTSPSNILAGSKERNLGKQTILGCGYNMGRHKFKITCQGYGIEIDDALAEKSVKSYRAKFARVPAFWKECEEAAISAVLTPGRIFTAGKVKWRVVDDFLYAKLPSGRKIAYHKPHLSRKKTPWGEMKAALCYWGVDSTTKKYGRQHTYGGKLVENITQGVARDFMAEAMFRLEARGYSLLMSVHDELVAEVDKDFGSLKEFEMLMAQIPEWGAGCPIEVEGWEGQRFKK